MDKAQEACGVPALEEMAGDKKVHIERAWACCRNVSCTLPGTLNWASNLRVSFASRAGSNCHRRRKQSHEHNHEHVKAGKLG